MLAWMAVSMPFPAAARGGGGLQLQARVHEFGAFLGAQLAAFPQLGPDFPDAKIAVAHIYVVKKNEATRPDLW